MTGVVDRLLFR